MAIKVSGTTVIDDTIKVITGTNYGTGLNGVYSNFHPDGIDTITTAIDFHKPIMKLAMSGNVTFTTTNTQLGATATITKLRKYSLNLYKELEKKTELSTGLKQNGAITIASTK